MTGSPAPESPESVRPSARPAGIWNALVILVLLVSSVLVTVSVGAKSYDDAYITYRYARNLALGQGFVYNVGDAWLGTTTPLLALLLALPARILSPDLIPQAGQWLSGLALFSLALFVYLLARTDHRPIAGGVSAVLLVLNPVVPSFWGGEALLLLAFVVGGIHSYLRGRHALAGAALALACLTRGEGALAALVVAAHFAVVQRKFPWRGACAFGALVVPWTIYAGAMFGSPFPSTLQAKMAQMQSGYFSPFLARAVREMAAYVFPIASIPRESSPAYLVVAFLAGVGGFVLLREPRARYWLILAWVGLYVLGYSLLGIPFYHWYMAPLVLGGAILAGVGAQAVADRVVTSSAMQPPSFRWAAWIVATILLAMPLAAAGRSLRDLARRPLSPTQRLYSNAGRWLRQNTEPNHTVGYFEIGFIGYYGDRKMIDPVGLATPGAWRHVAQGDFRWAYLRYQPDYLLVNSVRWYDRIGGIRDEAWFDAAYRKVAQIEEPGYFDAPLTVYRKTDAAAIPPPPRPD